MASITSYTKAEIDEQLGAKANTADLGTAATASVGDFATAAQGSKADASDVAAITLTAPLALTIPAGFPAGQVYRVTLTQDGTGGHTVTYGGSPVTVDTAAAAASTVELVPAGAGYVVVYPPRAALGTAATTDANAYATAAQGAKIDAPHEGVTWDVDVDAASATIEPFSPVAISTYAGPPDFVVHPSVLFFDDGWNGWRYWMAYTPYNAADIAVENPSIAVSNDGDTWTTPAGLINPVVARPGTGYNADPNLFMSPDGTMNMVWKVVTPTGSKETRLSSTRDGVTWTPSVLLFTNSFEDVSPAVLYDNGQYRMWTVKHADTPNTMYLRTAPQPSGPWSAPVACTLALPAGVEPWHMDVKRMGQQYHCVIQSHNSNQLYFGKSNDGLAWGFSSQPIMRAGVSPHHAFYKPAILPRLTHGSLSYEMWYSTMVGPGSVPDYRLYKTVLTFDGADRLRDELVSILSAFSGLQGYAAADSFNRADTTAGLGTATSGQSWTGVMGNDLGIAGGRACLPVAGNSRAILESGSADIEVGVTLDTLGAACWLMFRYVDAVNLWRVGQAGGGALQLQKIVAGTLTAMMPLVFLVAAGDRLSVTAKGSEIRVFLNRRCVYSVTDADNAAGTKVGLNVDNTVTRYDNLAVRRI